MIQEKCWADLFPFDANYLIQLADLHLYKNILSLNMRLNFLLWWILSAAIHWLTHTDPHTRTHAHTHTHVSSLTHLLCFCASIPQIPICRFSSPLPWGSRLILPPSSSSPPTVPASSVPVATALLYLNMYPNITSISLLSFPPDPLSNLLRL